MEMDARLAWMPCGDPNSLAAQEGFSVAPVLDAWKYSIQYPHQSLRRAQNFTQPVLGSSLPLALRSQAEVFVFTDRSTNDKTCWFL